MSLCRHREEWGFDLTNVIRRAMILLAVRVLTPGIEQAMALTGIITPLSGVLI